MRLLLGWYFVAVWGAGYVATKVGLQYAAPFTFLTLRFCFGLLCLVPVLFFVRIKWPGNRAELWHLVIAGLLDNQTTEQLNKIPGLANLPVLGKLFQSKSLLKNNSELMIMVMTGTSEQ